MTHKHSVYDTDPHFSINPITKMIQNESSKKTTLIQGDHNSERFTFEMPRYIEGHDMMLCDLVEVHFDNKETGTENISSDYYEVNDLQTSPHDLNIVIFSWLIIDTATKYAGSLEFSITFKCTQEGVCTYKWGTNLNTDISVSKGKDNSGVVVERSPNVVDQWHEQIFGDAENAVSNINLAEQNALEAVQAEGAAQVANVQAVIEPVKATVDQVWNNSRLKASVIEGNAEGNVILLDDSAEQPFVEFSVFGKSTQVQNNGTQLIPFPYTTSDGIRNGITFKANDDGSLSAKGTATAITDFNFVNNLFLSAGTYTMWYTGDFSGEFIWIVDNKKSSAVTVLYQTNESNSSTFTINEDIENVYIGCRYPVGAIADDTIHLMLNKGDTALPYEIYNGGVVTPSPENPSEIIGVGNPEIAVWGKNLLQNTTGKATNSGITYTPQADGSIKIQGTATAQSYYTFDFGNEIPAHGKGMIASMYGCTGGTSLTVGYFKEDSSTVNQIAFANNSEYEFEYPKEAAKTRTFITVNEGTTVDTVLYPMVRFADTDDEYKAPEVVQKLEIPYTLHGIPVTSGGNYTDQNGQQWICDEIDFERGVLVQRCGSYIFDGSTDEEWNGIYSHDSKKYVYVKVPRGSIQYLTPLLCNYAKMGAWSSDNVCFINNYAEFVVGGIALESVLTSVATFRTHLAENPIMLVYVLETPVETALSEAEIATFRALHSNKLTTTILNDSEAHMGVVYGIDTKTYIDNKIAELLATE